jgi:protein-disulfide isomerase
LIGAATLAGIGFTVSLLIADISFRGKALEDAKLGILLASITASILSWIVFRVIGRLPTRALLAGGDRVAPPIEDLMDPVDPDVDHIRGPEDAPVTLVEYGDFECPHCGRAERVVRNLLAGFGTDVRFVFRHLPLTDVHEHAQIAAEASEAAAAQGAFWEMHDVLLAHQDELSFGDLVRHAAELGLDTDRFANDLRHRRYALRIARDVQSADQSGVAGTPTFFVNGRRHLGAYDEATLTELVRGSLPSSGAPKPARPRTG